MYKSYILLSVTSTFVCVVSVKRRNLIPVKLVKHWMRKFSVSNTSIPEEGSGLLGIPPGGVGGAKGLMGLSPAAMRSILKSCEF